MDIKARYVLFGIVAVTVGFAAMNGLAAEKPNIVLVMADDKY